MSAARRPERQAVAVVGGLTLTSAREPRDMRGSAWCACGWTRTARGLEAAQALTAEATAHKQTCAAQGRQEETKK
ncbi:hypothetical protein ABZ697_30890 [Streptomyces albidoflavus]|uniref:hypothetical protein n=1 Tax=Streptomyces albidoflavus TaxID=1886 RepID=UPI00340CACFC